MKRLTIPDSWYIPDRRTGLSEKQVAERRADGRVNVSARSGTKSYGRILHENVFTFFNFVNFVLAVLVLMTGSYKNLMFMGTVLCNIFIGTFQEIRAKRTLDRLSILTAARTDVLRAGRHARVPAQDVVENDLMTLHPGDQVSADAVLLSGPVELNESLLTGESEPVVKNAGDSVFSGSFVVSGSAQACALRVGKDSYAGRLALSASKSRDKRTEISRSIDIIIKTITIIVVPVAVLNFLKMTLFLKQTAAAAILSTTASVLGMIPEGLVLLVSMVTAVSVVRLAMHKTLVQRMPCVETLAHVDMLCLDKTGTLTEGKLEVRDFVPFKNTSVRQMRQDLADLLGAFSSEDDNLTFQALRAAVGEKAQATALESTPFSSARRMSAARFKDKTLVLGAGETVLGAAFEPYAETEQDYTKNGMRVLLLAEETANKKTPLGFIVLSDTIRKEAPQTLAYFKDQGVQIKIISGDDPVTAAAIARRAGLENTDKQIDMSQVKTQDALERAALTCTVFGRTAPEQKEQLIAALQRAGHTVGMTGDGVNDVPALRRADTSVAMASGNDAARAVSDLVLLDSNFASMPAVVAEGRRLINNLERSGVLFLTKTTFSVLLALMYLCMNTPFPFYPVQLTIIGSLTIGIPSFFLALEPNKDRVRGRFLRNVLLRALPAGLAMFAGTAAASWLGHFYALSTTQISTLCVYTTASAGFMLIAELCRPFNVWRALLLTTLMGVFLALVYFFGPFFYLAPLTQTMAVVLSVLIGSEALVFYLLSKPRVSEALARRADAVLTGRFKTRRKNL